MATSTSNRHRMRCSRCRARFTLKRHPDLYQRAVRCPSCQSLTVYSCEAARRRELAKQETCHCPNFPFPHRSGSLRLCWNHPKIEQSPTEEEVEHYKSILATPRSSFE